LAREGLGIIVGMVLFAAIMITGAIVSPFLHLQIMAGTVLLLTLITVYFFGIRSGQFQIALTRSFRPQMGK